MDKWEYCTVVLQPLVKNLISKQWDAGYLSHQLNQYGALGWELVSCYTIEADAINGHGGGTSTILASFKRKVIV